MDEPARTAAQAPTPRGVDVDALMASGPIVLFDGVCNFCNSMIQFVVDNERTPTLNFAPLQSEIARGLLERVFGEDEAKRLLRGATGEGDPDSVVLIEGGRGYTHSTAGLRILGRLRAPWRWLSALVIVPSPIRDAVYRWIGRNRYRWFGKSETCRIPTPELRARFLS